MSGNATVCSGSSQTYSVTSVSGATSYAWTLTSGWTGTSTTTSIVAIPNTTSGLVAVSAVNSCGSSSSRNLFVTVNTVPATPGTISGNSSICSGSVQTYSIASVAGAISYSWVLPSGWNGTSTSTSITVTSGTSGGSIVVYANNSCGTSNIRTFAVTINSTPTQPGTITGNTMACSGSSQTYSISSVTGATSYTWTLPSGWSGTSSTTSITGVAGSSGGTISIIANSSCGNSSARMLAVTVISNPAHPGTITGTTAVCPSTSHTYTISAVSGATGYIWTLPSGWSGSSTSASITANSGTSGGNITVSAVNSCGNSSAQTLAVTVNSITAVTISSNPANDNFCTQVSPSNVQLIASSGFNSYAWSPSGGSTRTATISTVCTFVVTATNSSGCTTTASIAVSNNCALPTSLSTTSIEAAQATANWIQSQCAVNYTIQISKHGLNTWTNHTVTGSNYTFTGLTHSTSYDWRIETNCNTSGSTNSGYSAIQTFTTPAHRMAAEDGTSNAVLPFNVYPNPADAMVTITFSTMEEGAYSIRLVDMMGRVVKSEIDNAGLGDNSYIMNLDGVTKGMYIVILQKGDNIFKAKLVVE